MSSVNFNKYKDMPEIPYKILLYLIMNNDNIFKLLKYDTNDALSKPNLTEEEKLKLLYTDEIGTLENNFRIFMKPLVGDEVLDACTQLRFFKSVMSPQDRMTTTINYEFDIINGSKINIVYNENGIPCSRLDLIESEILKTLNGKDIAGYGYFQFNRELSRNCGQRLSLGNSKTFYGSALVFAVNYMDNEVGLCDD